MDQSTHDYAGHTVPGPTVWHPQSRDGLEVTRVQFDEPLISRRGEGRATLAPNSHVDLCSDGRGEVDARVSVNERSVATLRLHLCRADGMRIYSVDVPQLAVADAAKWKPWRAAFTFPAKDYPDVATVDLDFDATPSLT